MNNVSKALLVSNRMHSLVRAATFVLIASIASWFLLIYITHLANSLSLNPNRCEIVGLLNNCPGQSSFKITRTDGLVLDDVRGASKDIKVCKSRAEEFYQWCSSKTPIKARFFNNGKLEGQWVYPAK